MNLKHEPAILLSHYRNHRSVSSLENTASVSATIGNVHADWLMLRIPPVQPRKHPRHLSQGHPICAMATLVIPPSLEATPLRFNPPWVSLLCWFFSLVPWFFTALGIRNSQKHAIYNPSKNIHCWFPSKFDDLWGLKTMVQYQDQKYVTCHA